MYYGVAAGEALAAVAPGRRDPPLDWGTIVDEVLELLVVDGARARAFLFMFCVRTLVLLRVIVCVLRLCVQVCICMSVCVCAPMRACIRACIAPD